MRRLIPRAALVATTAVLLGIGGCATMHGLAAPEVSLVDLRFASITVLESTLELELRLANDNPEPLVVDGGVFQVELDGELIGKGATGERFEIPRLDSTVRTVTLHVSHLDAIRRVRSIMENHRFAYALKGNLYVIHGGGTVKLKVEKRGDLDLQRDLGRGRTQPAEETPPG